MRNKIILSYWVVLCLSQFPTEFQTEGARLWTREAWHDPQRQHLSRSSRQVHPSHNRQTTDAQPSMEREIPIVSTGPLLSAFIIAISVNFRLTLKNFSTVVIQCCYVISLNRRRCHILRWNVMLNCYSLFVRSNRDLFFKKSLH